MCSMPQAGADQSQRVSCCVGGGAAVAMTDLKPVLGMESPDPCLYLNPGGLPLHDKCEKSTLCQFILLLIRKALYRGKGGGSNR